MTKKLDPAAGAKVDKAFYSEHPELHGRELTTSPKDAALRKEWLNRYSKIASKPKPPAPRVTPKATASSSPPSLSPIQACPYAKTSQIIQPNALSNTSSSNYNVQSRALEIGEHAADIFGESAKLGAEYLTAAETYSKWINFGITSETSASISHMAVESSPLLQGLARLSLYASLILPTKTSIEAIIETDYNKKVAASSTAWRTSAVAVTILGIGGLATLGVGALVAASAPVWAIVGVAIVAAAVVLAVGWGVGKAWDTWADPAIKKYYSI